MSHLKSLRGFLISESDDWTDRDSISDSSSTRQKFGIKELKGFQTEGNRSDSIEPAESTCDSEFEETISS